MTGYDYIQKAIFIVACSVAFAVSVVMIIGLIFWIADKVAFRKYQKKGMKRLMDYAKEKPPTEESKSDAYETTFLQKSNLVPNEYQLN